MFRQFRAVWHKAMLVLLTVAAFALFAERGSATEQPLSLVVMDPLAAPLSCPCVEGYAQRDYEKYAAALSEKLGREVVVTFAESLEKALAEESCSHIDIIIGKDSVVRSDAEKLELHTSPVAQLTGKDGMLTQTGLIVVPSDDPAQGVRDLAGYRIIFGGPECDEKFIAARNLLTSAGVSVPAPEKTEISGACSDGATQILEMEEGQHGAAVISSYAAPLLEGCGTVKKGDLRIVGETKPVPFVAVFLTERVPADKQDTVRQAVIDASRAPEMLMALESLLGFVPLHSAYHEWHAEQHAEGPATAVESDTPKKTSGATSSSETPADDQATDFKPKDTWPGWRGANRDGHAGWLPQQFAEELPIVWQQPMMHEGLGGIAATHEVVIVGDRDFSNMMDEFRCYDAETGAPKWIVRYPAPGKLDYDNSPRTTPLIHGDRVYLLGAFGDLRCVDLETGLVQWQQNLLRKFAATTNLIWGTCSTPLVVDDKLIVNPGAADASWVALDTTTGETLWQTSGAAHAYASPMLVEINAIRQLIVYDRESLSGLDPETGARLWSYRPPDSGDFNVPSPVMMGEQLLLTSENNGTRLFEFSADGNLQTQPTSTYSTLAPNMSTPVAIGDRVFCVADDLFCLDAENELREVWIGSDPAFGDYGSTIATDDRLLVVGRGGELLLIDPHAEELKIVSRQTPLPASQSGSEVIYAQPAMVGKLLYLRVGKRLACVDLGQ